ncbi:unnamed protein product [Phytophthora lilii]|uniref:Unnamed protein product n=1 Tax=Phytophthora lilii TaxID=2077276 RepID=A0A9W6TJB4_9STRA|nr:unnamed protein product [Phytophthora lilii]
MAEQQSKKTPSDFLKGVLGRPVDVKLNNGVEYKGVLACLDGFMNIAMEQTQEYSNGQLKAQYGDCFIRGNNGETRCLLARSELHSNGRALLLFMPWQCSTSQHPSDATQKRPLKEFSSASANTASFAATSCCTFDTQPFVSRV